MVFRFHLKFEWNQIENAYQQELHFHLKLLFTLFLYRKFYEYYLVILKPASSYTFKIVLSISLLQQIFLILSNIYAMLSVLQPSWFQYYN
ncbi:unnamed protein product [Paramecium sonneborni]|uniref:Transmembrane protein n=1 Tax=Paramecium sonneborni TaxID=65129 RepID=A0A8S1LW50_9CILI|nr:unnamed protein product [Paramecium sonneborni]